MQRSIDISSAEWRWVITFSALLVGLTLLPYALAFVADQSVTAWHFMGILPNPLDGATYLSKIAEGLRGQWLFTLAYTPEVSNGVAINLFYIFLGQLARLTSFSPLLTYHLARVATSFVMYLTLYHLGASIWQKLRARRLFFGIVGIGSGLGWIALFLFPIQTGIQPVDLYVPESIPLYAAFVNPHFPLAIGIVALLTAQFNLVFRPGYTQMPSPANGGILVGVLTFFLALLQPQAWLPFGVALAAYLVLQTIRSRQRPKRFELAWIALAIIPALPVLAYDLYITAADPIYKSWNAQNQTPSGSPLNYAFGFGLLWIIAAPGILRAVRRFERDGDRFMVTWLITDLLLLYAPINLQRRLVIGLIIPLAYFCVRSLQEYWLESVRPRSRSLIIVLLFVFILPSNVLTLILPVPSILNPRIGLENHVLLDKDYTQALDWFRVYGKPDSVVMAMPDLSLWLPAYSTLRPVYGHPFETVDAAKKLETVKTFYSGEDCTLNRPTYTVSYVVIGPNMVPDSTDNLVPAPENTVCKQQLGSELARFGSVAIYAAAP